MKSIDTLSFEDRRLHLRQQMWARRQQLSEKLHSSPRTDISPRSLTMRFLTQGGGARLALTFATAMLGGRKLQLLSTMLLVSGVAYLLLGEKR